MEVDTCLGFWWRNNLLLIKIQMLADSFSLVWYQGLWIITRKSFLEANIHFKLWSKGILFILFFIMRHFLSNSYSSEFFILSHSTEESPCAFDSVMIYNCVRRIYRKRTTRMEQTHPVKEWVMMSQAIMVKILWEMRQIESSQPHIGSGTKLVMDQRRFCACPEIFQKDPV